MKKKLFVFYFIGLAMLLNPFGILVLLHHALEVTIASLVAKHVLKVKLLLVLIQRISLSHVVSSL